jgi:hypothetical protein
VNHVFLAEFLGGLRITVRPIAHCHSFDARGSRGEWSDHLLILQNMGHPRPILPLPVQEGSISALINQLETIAFPDNLGVSSGKDRNYSQTP